jgi:hypothetical protein
MLLRITGSQKFFNGTLVNAEIKILSTTSHIPNGGFTALCKAFRPLKLHHGLTVESPAIRH